MLVFELNIGLNVVGGDNSPEAVQARYETLKGLLARGIPSCRATNLRPECVGCGSPEIAVAVLLAPGAGEAMYLAGKLSYEMSQDCVALYQPPTEDGLEGRGWLIGPEAYRRGAFSLDNFARF